MLSETIPEYMGASGKSYYIANESNGAAEYSKYFVSNNYSASTTACAVIVSHGSIHIISRPWHTPHPSPARAIHWMHSHREPQ